MQPVKPETLPNHAFYTITIHRAAGAFSGDDKTQPGRTISVYPGKDQDVPVG